MLKVMRDLIDLLDPEKEYSLRRALINYGNTLTAEYYRVTVQHHIVVAHRPVNPQTVRKLIDLGVLSVQACQVRTRYELLWPNYPENTNAD